MAKTLDELYNAASEFVGSNGTVIVEERRERYGEVSQERRYRLVVRWASASGAREMDIKMLTLDELWARLKFEQERSPSKDKHGNEND